MLAGKAKANRSQQAWLRTYGALEHRDARKRCTGPSIRIFPDAIQEFAHHFVNTQRLRHNADYNPSRKFELSEVVQKIDSTEGIIAEFRKAPAGDLRAFAIHILFRERQD